MTYCDDCKSEHLGAPCGMSWIDRMRSVRIDGGVLETRTKRNYYDREPVHGMFGDTAQEQMEKETDGLGYARTASDGQVYHRDRHSGEVVPVTDAQLDHQYLGGRTERDLDPAEVW